MTMKLLNELYDESCKVKYKSYKKISNNIILIDNFFENIENAKKFFISADKWKCTKEMGGTYKPGYESIFPSWIGYSLLQKFLEDYEIFFDPHSFHVVCNFFYYDDHNESRSLTHSNYYPHIDSVQNEDNTSYVCLINLNSIVASTKFYAYKNQEICTKEMKTDWDKNTSIILEKLNKQNIKTDNQLRIFLDKEPGTNVKLVKNVEYKPNQAIFYPSNLFHSPNITQEFNKNNPRILLRISFNGKTIKQRSKINYS